MSHRLWSEKDLVRRANRRLAVLRHAEEVSGSVAATCRYFGISRTVFYKWKRRFEDEGIEGLRDRACYEGSPRSGRMQPRCPAGVS